MSTKLIAIALSACALAACQKQSATPAAATSGTEAADYSYGKLADGREVKLFTLTNKNGLRARVTEFGAILVSMEIPDKNGKLADVTHGYDTLEGWVGDTSYMGSSVGRFGNRIKDGKFTLEGKEYTLATNNSPGDIPCHLHGGKVGFNKVLWTGKRLSDQAVEFTYLSKDGEEGYPGNLTTKITYTLNDDNELKWEAQATTDAPTILNLVHHSYWNLTGDPTKKINDHLLQLEADQYLPTNAGLIPTGEKAPVADTPMDFTKPTAIGARVENDFPALKLGLGYDHCWVLRPGSGVRLAARLVEPESGRVMEVSTNQPAIQFYGGNFLDGTAVGKQGVAYQHRTALCLETENYPDAPNQPSFPSCVLQPGETYHHIMVHKFSVQK
jgi:aldose 1-epimerase